MTPVINVDSSGHLFFTALLVGFVVGGLVGGLFETGKQIHSNGWNPEEWDLAQIGLSALGGAVAGAISAIPIGGAGVLSYLGTFALGGTASVVGGYISGSVTDLKSAAFAFAIGGVASVAARGITSLISKNVKVAAQKTQQNSYVFEDLTLGDLAGSGLKNNGLSPAYKKLLDFASNTVLKANGAWAKSFMYSFSNSGMSSLFSGWY